MEIFRFYFVWARRIQGRVEKFFQNWELLKSTSKKDLGRGKHGFMTWWYGISLEGSLSLKGRNLVFEFQKFTDKNLKQTI